MSNKLFNEIDWVTEEASEFAQYWRSLAKPGELPRQSFFNPAAIPHLLPGVAIYELREDNRITCRLMGTGVVEQFGRDFTDRNILNWWAEGERDNAESVLRYMAEKPCGILARVTAFTENNSSVTGISVGFPALDRDGEIKRLLFYTHNLDQSGDRITRNDRVTRFEVDEHTTISLS